MITTIHTHLHRAADLAVVCRPGMDRAIGTSPASTPATEKCRFVGNYQGRARFT